MDTVTLEKYKIRVNQHLVPELLAEANIDIVEDILGQMEVSIRGYVWGERVQRQEFHYPADWWQAFKERWFPGWALHRWPVIYNHTVIDAMALYPGFRPSIPDRKSTIIVNKFTMMGYND